MRKPIDCLTTDHLPYVATMTRHDEHGKAARVHATAHEVEEQHLVCSVLSNRQSDDATKSSPPHPGRHMRATVIYRGGTSTLLSTSF
ncbi:hypothetical protein ACFSUK_15135 [Sphingobium scionense]|uniref:Uncharacterized protein n=1 Tax=Sphingobium scionense TaxID=1404341 RepID=A0A7W6LQD7_9SPHN|nr:hypothetical protein [Sphingobium scionense]MBB4148591.1 hypothetical protein [Sphingobium scionense]